MRFLLVIAHGSRRSESNEDFASIAAALGQHDDNPFDETRWAFLELAKPSIPEAVDRCVSEGASELVVFTYFLSPGTHVARDIPELLEEKQRVYPNIKITTLDYFGNSHVVMDWLLQHLNHHDKQEVN